MYDNKNKLCFFFCIKVALYLIYFATTVCTCQKICWYSHEWIGWLLLVGFIKRGIGIANEMWMRWKYFCTLNHHIINNVYSYIYKYLLMNDRINEVGSFEIYSSYGWKWAVFRQRIAGRKLWDMLISQLHRVENIGYWSSSVTLLHLLIEASKAKTVHTWVNADVNHTHDLRVKE